MNDERGTGNHGEQGSRPMFIVHRSSFIVSILNDGNRHENEEKRSTSSHVHRSSFIVHRFHPERKRRETEDFVPCSSFIVSILNDGNRHENEEKRSTSSHVHRSSFIVHRSNFIIVPRSHPLRSGLPFRE